MRPHLLLFGLACLTLSSDGFSQPIASTPVLKSARLTILTTDDDKDRASVLHASLIDKQAQAVFAYGTSGPERYSEGSQNAIDLSVSSSKVTKRDAMGFQLKMSWTFADSDTWIFKPTMQLTFSDGSVSTMVWGNTKLDSGTSDLLLESDGVQEIAERYAPQLMHPANEPNLPANVEWFLPHTSFNFRNSSCLKDNRSFGVSNLTLLQMSTITSACDSHIFTAYGTRSADKTRTFYISDADLEARKGSLRAADWVTYYHAYPNDVGGWTIQYWTFYPFNTGRTIHLAPLPPVEVGFHGGDWEMVGVVLDGQGKPTELSMTGHQDMISTAWSSVTTIGTHPIVYTEFGGHEVHVEALAAAAYIQHQTWPRSVVRGLPGGDQAPGPLVDLGTRLHPAVTWLAFSGLWGSPGALPSSSGYWGPAFNETGMHSDGFLAAWCSGIADPVEKDSVQRECFPRDPL